jgi:hypothetical protein
MPDEKLDEKNSEPSKEKSSIDSNALQANEHLDQKKSWFIRHQQHIYGWGSLVFAILVFFVPNWSGWLDSGKIDVSALKTELDVKVARSGNVIARNKKSFENVVPLATDDQMQVSGRFDQEVYCALIWVDQDGKSKVVATSGQSRTATINYPNDLNEWITVSGAEGTDLIFLAVSDTPILKNGGDFLAGLGTPPVFPKEGVIWIAPDKIDERIGKGRSPGDVVENSISDIYTHAGHVRDTLRLKVTDFEGVFFPH